jgi:pimeloyl-ACP methyl ester carboxylesterase
LPEKTLSTTGHKCKAIIHHASGTPIVFLHGFSYTGAIWQKISATTLLEEKHVPYLALDMPYGPKSDCHPKSRSDDVNVGVTNESIHSVFKMEIPVIVGASFGGRIALKYAVQNPVKGLLLISPARALDEDLVAAYNKFNFPVRIIWGSEDNIVSGEEMRVLSEKLPNAKLITYEGSSHSAYVNQPERFKRDLLELYALAEIAR